jgi:hypothetical protein
MNISILLVSMHVVIVNINNIDILQVPLFIVDNEYIGIYMYLS